MRYELRRLETIGLPFGYHPNHYVRYLAVCDAILRCSPRRTLLTLGCGPGMLEYVLPSGIHCTSIDLSPNAIAMAKEVNRYKSNRNFVLGNVYEVRQIVGEQSFDVVCISEVLEHLPDDDKVLRLAASMLSSNGYLVLTLPNGARFQNRVLRWMKREPILMAPSHLREYTVASAHQLLRASGLRPIDWRGVYFSFPRPYAMERFVSPYSRMHRVFSSIFPSGATYLLFTSRKEAAQ